MSELHPEQKARIQAMAAQKTAEIRDELARMGAPLTRGKLKAYHQGYVDGMTAGALGLMAALESGALRIEEGPSDP